MECRSDWWIDHAKADTHERAGGDDGLSSGDDGGAEAAVPAPREARTEQLVRDCAWWTACALSPTALACDDQRVEGPQAGQRAAELRTREMVREQVLVRKGIRHGADTYGTDQCAVCPASQPETGLFVDRVG